MTPTGYAVLTHSMKHSATSVRPLHDPFTALPAESEVVVIGGGAIGLLSALALRERGCEVTVVERRSFLGEASGVNAGTLSVQNKLTALVPYTLAALAHWQQLASVLGADVGYRQPGGLNVATSDGEVAALRRNAQKQQALGVRVRWMERADIARELSWLGPDVLAATSSPDDSYANPLAVGVALAQTLQRRGVRLVRETEVLGISQSSGARIRTTRGEIRAQQVLIACGVWSAGIAEMAGVRLPIALDVNMLSVTEPCTKIIPQVICHARGILTLKQTSNGTCLIGGGWQGSGTLQDERRDVEYESIMHNVRLAARIVPALRSVHIVRQWAGYEGVTPDSMPYLGRLPGSDCLFIAACARGGFTLSPILAQLICDEMTQNPPALSTQPFNPERHAHA